ncbi:MAG: DegV family protein [Clostridiaceae bacterium]|nr:DegV family protein [Clostridiaceae bacterium]
MGTFLAAYNKTLDEGYEIIAITASNLIDDTKVSVIDSETSAANFKILVEIALDLINQGISREEIVDKIEEQKNPWVFT